MDLDATITDLAKTAFGIHMLRPFQRIVIQRILELDSPQTDHAGLLVTLPTGSGKSLCFMLPSLLVEGLTIIVYPLRSLMNDQVRRFHHSNIACIAIQGGQTREERSSAFEKLSHSGCNVVITNAECLSQSSVIAELARHTISLLVLDEAHTIVRWGEEFRPALSALGPRLAFLPIRQILCFTATADHAVIDGLNHLIFTQSKPHLVRASSDRPNISYHAMRTLSKDHTLSSLLAGSDARPALVFCNTREATQFACKAFLHSHPAIPCRYYHAGLQAHQRKELETWFEKQTRGVLFSTNAFGMGVDKKNIRTVIHHQLPDDALSYLQESGRAGRDGNQSRAVVLLNGTEKGALVPCFTSHSVCYRESLLEKLGEAVEYCNGCDVCNRMCSSKREGEEALLSSIGWNPLRYSPSSLASLLTTDKAYSGFSRILQSWKLKEIRSALHVLLNEGKVKTITKHRRLYISAESYVELLTSHPIHQMLKHGTKKFRTYRPQDIPDSSASVSPGEAGRIPQ